jgi:hypothetical protein
MAVYEISNLSIEKGTDFNESFKILNDDGSPLGINSTFSGIAKLRKYSTSPYSYPFNVDLNEETSEVVISMAATMTATLPSGRCYFDLILIYGTTEIVTKKYLKGNIKVEDTASL